METTTTITVVGATETSKAKDFEGLTIFNMRSLSVHLPHNTNKDSKTISRRKGLSKYFSGKSRSFACLADAKSVEDLQKAELPEAKRRKYSDRQETPLLPTLSCWNESTCASYCRSCVGV